MTQKTNDPFYERERDKYEEPVPSREYILQILTEYGRPIVKSDLFKQLGVKKKSAQKSLMFRLRAMLRDGQMLMDRKGRFCITEKTTLTKGRIQAQGEGLGFFIPEHGGGDWVLSGKEMRTCMHGDIVLAYSVGADRRGRPEARIDSILERAVHSIAGRFIEKEDVCYIEPLHRYHFYDILIPKSHSNGAKSGQMVIVKITEYPTRNSLAIGHVEKILGDYLDPGLEIDVALLNFGIPHHLNNEVLSESHLVPKNVREQDLKGRKDLRHLPFVTIDGSDAKDFDDAVCCELLDKGNMRLWVAIADVSHYVLNGSAIDLDAQVRGNSVYFPGRVVPMLPEVLSNGICSLNPEVDRLCMVAEMVVTPKGQIKSSKFYRAVIHSKNRLIYEDVSAYLTAGEAPILSDVVWQMLLNLQKIYDCLSEARVQRGAIELDSLETKVIFDDQRKIEKIVPVERTKAHRMIEECMLAANVAVAQFLETELPYAIYRVHEQPDIEKMKSLQNFLGEFGIKTQWQGKLAPKKFQAVLAQIRQRPEKQVLETIVLRSLKQAQYAVENLGHFGLAYDVYTHFTSPIRRYPDLLVHRLLGAVLDHNKEIEKDFSKERLGQLALQSSMTERRADDATRDVLTWLKCIYMKDKVGQTFEGTISAVTSFGLFVTIKDIYVEGLIHVTSLKNDYYQFDALRHRLVGERTHQTYHLGDAISVLVARVSPDSRKIDFELIKEDSKNEG